MWGKILMFKRRKLGICVFWDIPSGFIFLLLLENLIFFVINNYVLGHVHFSSFLGGAFTQLFGPVPVPKLVFSC